MKHNNNIWKAWIFVGLSEHAKQFIFSAPGRNVEYNVYGQQMLLPYHCMPRDVNMSSLSWYSL